MAKVQKNAQSTKENTVFLLFLIATPHFECEATFIPIAKWREGSKIKTGGRREGEPSTLPCPQPFVYRHLKPVTGPREGYFRIRWFLVSNSICFIVYSRLPQRSLALSPTPSDSESEACGLAVRRHGLKRAIQYFERYGLFSRAGCVMLNTMAEEIARLLCHDG